MKYLFLFSLLLLGALPAQAQMAVIAHPGVSEASLDRRGALDVFTLEKTRLGSTRVVTFTLSGADAEAFYSAIGRSHNDIKKDWLRKKLAGEGEPPAQVGSAAEMIAKVSSTPGAIGFVPASAVNASVKVLARF